MITGYAWMAQNTRILAAEQLTIMVAGVIDFRPI